MNRACVLLILAASAIPVAAPAAATPALAPHRAVYDLALDKATDRSGITALAGRMVYEFNGSACEGYTVNFRFVTQIDTREVSRLTDQQTTTFEDAEGKNFSFVTKSYIDRNLDKELRGTATRGTKGLHVELEKPEKASLELAPTQFPTQHLLELLKKARAGETFFETDLFDGSDDGDKVMTTTVVVGKEASPKANDPEIKADSAFLSKDQYWPIDIAYFDLEAGSGEELPEYRISFKLHQNGITRDLIMDYGDFSMKGKLVDLAMLPEPKACPSK
ncbi:MAG: cell envelope integrity EipB family protein [Rhizobiaceae bacterium]|nr:cell envelope integrity EipB family protein [Rhizobiaceae bacterium]